MPRTRLGNKKSTMKDTSSKSKVVSHAEKRALLERFDKQIAEQKLKLTNLYEQYLAELDKGMRHIIVSIPKSDLSKTIEQLKSSNSVTNTLSATSVCSSTLNSKTFVSCDEGYLTESLDQLSELRMTKMKNISDKSTTDMFKTPITSKLMHNPSNTFGLVTPKVTPNAQLTVLRRPKKGEMVISMAGSPLQVNAVVTEEKANVNIPLGDGVVMSVQPNRGELRMSQVPQITDEKTKQEIETLIKHLSAIVKK